MTNCERSGPSTGDISSLGEGAPHGATSGLFTGHPRSQALGTSQRQRVTWIVSFSSLQTPSNRCTRGRGPGVLVPGFHKPWVGWQVRPSQSQVVGMAPRPPSAPWADPGFPSRAAPSPPGPRGRVLTAHAHIAGGYGPCTPALPPSPAASLCRCTALARPSGPQWVCDFSRVGCSKAELGWVPPHPRGPSRPPSCWLPDPAELPSHRIQENQLGTEGGPSPTQEPGDRLTRGSCVVFGVTLPVTPRLPPS